MTTGRINQVALRKLTKLRGEPSNEDLERATKQGTHTESKKEFKKYFPRSEANSKRTLCFSDRLQARQTTDDFPTPAMF
jgi:hypothetical protein